MKIKVIDFEVVTRHYKTYRDGMRMIELQKDILLESLKPLKKEIQEIMISNAQQSVFDRRVRETRAENFEKLQKQAIELENRFNENVGRITNDTNSKSFEELQVIISEWGEQNEIDLITSKMEVIYNSSSIDATQEIIDLLKSKNLYVDYQDPKKENKFQIDQIEEKKES